MKTPAVVLLSVGISLMAFSPLRAATIHVDSDKGDDLRDGTAAEPKATIGAAIAVAAAGDRILVAPGEYAESISVTLSRIVLAATRPGRVRLDGRLTLKCNDTVIDGLSWSGHNGGAILNIYGKRNIVRRCRFREFGRKFACKGIWIRQTGDHGDNRIEHCLFEDWTGHGSSSCIKVSQNGSETAFTGTVIRNNVFRRGNRPGNNTAIQIYCPTLVEHNIIYDCVDGIEGKGGDNTIRHNVVFRCSGAETMSNRSGSNNLFENNLLFENTLAWEIYSGSNNTWRKNTVLNCQMIARIKRGGPGGFRKMLLEHNLFSANRRGFSFEDVTCPVDHIHFHKNTFIGGGKIETEGRGHHRETDRIEPSTWPKNQGVKDVFALLYKLAPVAGPSGGHVDLADARPHLLVQLLHALGQALHLWSQLISTDDNGVRRNRWQRRAPSGILGIRFCWHCAVCPFFSHSTSSLVPLFAPISSAHFCSSRPNWSCFCEKKKVNFHSVSSK